MSDSVVKSTMARHKQVAEVMTTVDLLGLAETGTGV